MARKQDGRIPELDGFRVLMVGIVAWFHFWQQSWLTPYIGSYSLDYLVRAGYMAVDGTILLSGFLLFLPYARAQHDGLPEPGAKSFYRRRIMRIMPSYLFTVFLMLFAVVIPYHQYSDIGSLLYDILMHVLCIFTWDRRTYLGSQLGGSAWTIAVEMQLYLIVPLLGHMARKKPLAVMFAMCAISAYFRGCCIFFMEEYSMVVNQPLSFLDVYALGMACAYGYTYFIDWLEKADTKKRRIVSIAATLLFFLAFWLFLQVLRKQAGSSGYPAIQGGQMIRRPVLVLTLAGVMMSLPFAVKPLRLLFGNPVMRFLSGISMNFYLLHQNIAVYLRRIGVPYSEFAYPNQEGDKPWQYQYTALVILLSLLGAVLVTYLIEKPAAKGMRKIFDRHDRKKEELARTQILTRHDSARDEEKISSERQE